MALARPLPPLWQTLLPSLNGPVRPLVDLPLLQRLSQSFRSLPTPFAALAIPSLSLPSFPSLSDIWEGVLKAVPKKKTSHRKKRQRFMAGKGLKDLTNLNRCSACGRVKRAHLLCPYCVHTIQTKIFEMTGWTKRFPNGLTKKMQKQRKRESIEERRRDRTMEPVPESGPGKLGKATKW